MEEDESGEEYGAESSSDDAWLINIW
jgi:hypothetical protein